VGTDSRAASQSAPAFKPRSADSKPERFVEATAPPEEREAASPVPRAASRKRDETPVPPATHSERWLMRVARLWDGTALFASLVVVAALIATAVLGISSPPITFGLPLLVGSMLRVDAATRKSPARIDRLARTLRVSPTVRLLGHRQRAANWAASAIVAHFIVGAFATPAQVELLHACAASLVAAIVLVFAIRARSGESREAWHQRMEVAERGAKRAAADASTFFPTVDPSLPKDAASSGGAASSSGEQPAAADGAPSVFGDAALDPCLIPVGPSELPDVARNALDLIAGTADGVKWSKPAIVHGCSVQTTKTAWCSSPASMFKTTFAGVRALSLYQCLYDDPTGVKGRGSYAFQIEEMLAERYLIRRVGRNEAYWYAAINSKFPGIAGRDFVNKVAPCTVLSKETRAKFGISDAPAFIYAAGPYAGDGAPGPNPPFVRAQMHRYGVLVQDKIDGSGVDVTMVVSLEPAGNVPSAAVAFANRDTAKKLRVLDSFVHNWERSHAVPPRLPDGAAGTAAKIEAAVAPTPSGTAANVAATAAAVGTAAPANKPAADAAAAPSTEKDSTPGTVEGTQVTPEPVVLGMELMKESGWERRGEKEGCTWDGKSVPYCKSEACLNRLFMPGVHAANFGAFCNDDPTLTRKDTNAYKLDELLQNQELLGEDPKDVTKSTSRIVNTFRSPFFGIGPRDFSIRYTREYYLSEGEKQRFGVGHPGCDVFVAAAVHDPTVPERKKFVRGQTHRFLLIAADRPDDSGCDVTQALANDAGGSLPVSIINGLAAANMDKLLKRKKLFQELEAKSGRMPKKSAALPAPPADTDDRDGGDAAAVTPAAPEVEKIPYEPRSGDLPAPFAKALELWRKKDWKESAKKEGAVQRSMPSPYCNKDALWMSCKAEGATLDDFDIAINDDRATLRPKDAPFKYDELLDKKEASKINEAAGEGSMILHSMFVTPSRFVAPRDTVTLLFHREPLSAEHQKAMKDLFTSETGRVLACAAVDASDEIPVKSPFQRGCTHVFSLWAVEQNDGVDMHLVMSFDPCGSIPGALVKTANAAQLTKVILMRQLTLAVAADRKAKQRQ